jgi:hypothetical protein
MGRRRPIWPAESEGATFRGLKWTYTSQLTLGSRVDDFGEARS